MSSLWKQLLATALIVNVALWVSTLYQIYDIESYSKAPVAYEVISWVILFGVFGGLLLLFAWCPHWIPFLPRGFVDGTIDFFDAFSSDAKFVALPNAALCFALVIAYLRAYAIPQYYEAEWEYGVEYNESLTPPGFAFVGGYDDAAMANFAGGNVTCTFPSWVSNSSNDCPPEAFNSTQQKILTNSDIYGILDAYVFDSKHLASGKNVSTELADRLLLQIKVNYNVRKLQKEYAETSVQTPYLFAVLFDSRLNLTGIATGLDCGFLALTEIPALASNTITVAANQILDKQRKIETNNENCQKFLQNVNAWENPPFTTYTFGISSMTNSEYSSCDISTDPSAVCISQLILRFGTHVKGLSGRWVRVVRPTFLTVTELEEWKAVNLRSISFRRGVVDRACSAGARIAYVRWGDQ
ncbi:hypothetical protein N7523_006135 [Penicillium sp. IBT 18751x]|nr:hypothetical protein N7523_006135 [Penicillium sp. IBT 18751x]